MNPDCPFCHLPRSRIILANELAVAIRDAYPVSPGHSLILPRRHVDSFFDATIEERMAMLALLDPIRKGLENEYRPDGYNVGINDGPSAGQTVFHLHLHLIPRRAGDRPDPRGGIRWIFPEKAQYWT
ncbi:MAG TPA: HIT family protein [Candidatus Desulfobacillus sp.]|nr:HIT family protein [Candidatus Desulfobacillus sp.]